MVPYIQMYDVVQATAQNTEQKCMEPYGINNHSHSHIGGSNKVHIAFRAKNNNKRIVCSNLFRNPFKGPQSTAP